MEMGDKRDSDFSLGLGYKLTYPRIERLSGGERRAPSEDQDSGRRKGGGADTLPTPPPFVRRASTWSGSLPLPARQEVHQVLKIGGIGHQSSGHDGRESRNYKGGGRHNGLSNVVLGRHAGFSRGRHIADIR